MKPHKFKTIGIIGGAGPVAGSLLFTKIITLCQKSLFAIEDEDYPEIILLNYPFSKMITIEKSNSNYTLITQELELCINKLINQKVEVIGIACNTLHSFLGKVPLHTYTNVTFKHIVKETIDYIKHKAIKKILLLATETTIKANLYPNHTIERILPDTNDQKLVTNIIYKILSNNISKQDSELLEDIVQKYHSTHSIDGVLLGCTELSVLHSAYQFKNAITDNVKIIDTLDILAHSLLQHALLLSPLKFRFTTTRVSPM